MVLLNYLKAGLKVILKNNPYLIIKEKITGLSRITNHGNEYSELNTNSTIYIAITETH